MESLHDCKNVLEKKSVLDITNQYKSSFGESHDSSMQVQIRPRDSPKKLSNWWAGFPGLERECALGPGGDQETHAQEHKGKVLWHREEHAFWSEDLHTN